MIRFEDLKSLDQGRTALAQELPQGTPRSAVEQMMRDAGASLYDENGGLLCIWEGSGVIHGKWLVSIAFDASNRLQRLGANYGVMAP
jgi:hypothetical protein